MQQKGKIIIAVIFSLLITFICFKDSRNPTVLTFQVMGLINKVPVLSKTIVKLQHLGDFENKIFTTKRNTITYALETKPKTVFYKGRKIELKTNDVYAPLSKEMLEIIYQYKFSKEGN